VANRVPLRDYLYVSTRKVERLAARLPEPAWERLTALDVRAPTPETEVSLAGVPPATVLGLAAEVESAVRDQHPVRSVSHLDLAVGHWFESTGMPMAYGVQAARRSTDRDAAVFVGRIDEYSAGAESSLLLSGSAEYLRDGLPTQVEDVSAEMSYPSALFSLLASLSDADVADVVQSDVELPARDRRGPSHRQAVPSVEQARDEQWLAVGYPLAQARSSFGKHGLFPLAFLAQVVKIVNFESDGLSGRWVVGSPLWVARQVPE
jgi:hypothetical protein